MKAFEHPHHVVACLLVGDRFDPAHGVHLAPAGVAVGDQPLADPPRTRVVGGGGEDVGPAVVVEHRAEIGGPQRRVVERIGGQPGGIVGRADLRRRRLGGGRHQLHQPARAGGAGGRGVELGFLPRDGQREFRRHRPVLLGHRVERVILAWQHHPVGGGVLGDAQPDMGPALVDLHLRERRALVGGQGFRGLAQELHRPRVVSGAREQQPRLHHAVVQEGRAPPVGDGLAPGDPRIRPGPDPLGGELAVEAGLVLRALQIGRLGLFGLARALLGEAEPVAGAAQADRGEDRRLEPLEMRGGELGVLHLGQGDVARHPFGVGVVGPRPLVAEVVRGQRIGGGDMAVAQRLAGEVRPALHPVVGPAQGLGRGRAGDEEALGLVPAALLDPVAIALVGEAGIVAQARGHRRDQRGRAVGVLAHRDPGPGQRLLVGGDARQHRRRLAGQAAPEQHVEARGVLGRHQRLVVGEDRLTLGLGQGHGAPGVDDLLVRRGLLAGRLQRLGETLCARPGQGGLLAEEGELDGGRQRRRHRAFGMAADRVAVRPARIAREKGLVLAPAAQAVAQAQPQDEVGRDPGAAAGDDRLRGGPVAGARRRQRLGERDGLGGGARPGGDGRGRRLGRDLRLGEGRAGKRQGQE